ncbi:N-acetylglucosamine-6-phosphate deacetylase [Paenibacillus sp. J31TS4]|uniref:N-acetylglucosamine-6-phosphate deacetylase n=1 Tax=Paenibacillus sp. J31TS4 TaxID=2807195 RepID=UPI001B0817DE|nr:N-acetylglucosamine-6-phosphate deacetylase [Paenibacillus sp. J31TS4]GIP38047.1 N-acetylglucosamine-6-phosphate deacetylase [Paenibacillus sp. J31TS4]
MRTLWTNAALYLPDGRREQGRLLVDETGRIEAAGGAELTASGPVRQIDAEGLTMLPGFVDVHMHGGNGYNVMDARYESLDGISRFHAAHGTTAFLATTNTSTGERIREALRCAAAAVERGVGGAELAGIHLEGPFLDVVRRGAQRKEDVRPPTPEEIDQFLEAGGGHIRLVTLAPELPGGLEAVRRFRGRGVTVSAGHSDATYAQMEAAVEAGVTHTTHHFNGMRPLHHREPGLAGAGLLLSELTTELIADGIHVHPAVVRLLFAVKSPGRVCMITDAVGCCGLPDGDYGHVRMTGGQVYLKDGETLAGSSLTMLQALRNVLAFTGLPLEAVLPSLTSVPARQVGLDGRKGTLEAGKDADFLLVDDELRLVATYVRGREVYRREEPAAE